LPDFGAHHERHKETLNKLQQRIRRIRPNRNMKDRLLLHDNARPHTSLRTREAVTKMAWAVRPHSVQSPGLVLPVWPVKDGRHFAHDNGLEQFFVMCSEAEASNFPTVVYSLLLSVGKSVLKITESF
jgi:hypothetical protein